MQSETQSEIIHHLVIHDVSREEGGALASTHHCELRGNRLRTCNLHSSMRGAHRKSNAMRQVLFLYCANEQISIQTVCCTLCATCENLIQIYHLKRHPAKSFTQHNTKRNRATAKVANMPAHARWIAIQRHSFGHKFVHVAHLDAPCDCCFIGGVERVGHGDLHAEL